MPETVSETEFFTFHEFEPELACEIPWAADSNDATHVCHCKKCTFSILICQHHIDVAATVVGPWFCDKCKLRGPLETVFSFSPIGGE